MSFDAARFTHPKILFAEVQVPANGGNPTELAVDALKTPRDMIIDWIGISEETYSGGIVGAPNDTYLQYLDVNWKIGERHKWRTQDLCRAIDLHSLPGDRTCNPCVVDLAGWGSLQWRSARPWMLNPGDGITLEWQNPPRAGGVPSVQMVIGAALHGAGVRSGGQRTTQVPLAVMPLAAINAVGVAGGGLNGENRSDEPVVIERFIVRFPGLGLIGVDQRALNHHRMRIVPSIGEGWSEPRVPLIFYGPHAGPPNRVCWHEPVGGPLYMRAGERISFSLRNNSAVVVNAQVACLGRIAPDFGGVR